MTVFAETPAAIGAGGCDWLAIWQQMYHAKRAQVETVMAPGQEQAGDHWESAVKQCVSILSRNDKLFAVCYTYLISSD